MNIPFFSFKKMNAEVKDGLMLSFEQVLDSGWYIMGNRLTDFESQYASYCGTGFCAGVANGLDALILSLRALGIGENDEVLVPSNTYIATLLAVSAVGAKPVLIEPDEQTYNLSVDQLQKALTGKTRAIIPVHLYGQACPMHEITAFASTHRLFVVEDNAQAQGASSQGKKTGSFGHLNATSFYPGKNLGALGNAGAVTSDSEVLLKKVKVLRNYGSEKKYYNSLKGINSRLDELQAALLSVKLQKLDAWNEERQAIARLYNLGLNHLNRLKLPFTHPNVTHVYHQYVIRTEQRDQLAQHLLKNGIHTMVHYPVPPHLQEAYPELAYLKGKLPLAEELARTSLSLPIYPGLTEKEIQHIVVTLQQFFE